MKLHLPNPLRAAVMACMAAVSSLGITLATGTLTGGVIAALLTASGEAAADTVTGSGTQQDPFVIASSSGAVTLVSYTPSGGSQYTFTENDYLKLQITGGNLTNSNEVVVANVEIGSLTLTNAFPGRTYTFQGSISGSGNISYNKTSLSGYQKWIFSGDVSQYTGTITINADASKDNSLTVSGGSDVNASSIQLTNANLILGKAGTSISVNSSTVSAKTISVVQDATAAFVGSVSATTLNVESGATVSLTGSAAATVTGGGTVNGTLSTGAGTALTLGGTLNLGDQGSLSIAGGLTLTGLTLTGSGTVDVTNLTSLSAETAGLTASETTEAEDGSVTNYYTVLTVSDTVQLVGMDASALDPSVWEWDAATGTLNYLVVTPGPSWDANWGKEGLAGAPVIKSMPTYAENASAMTTVSYAGVDSYFLGSQTGAVNTDGRTCLKIESAPSGSNKMVFGGVLDGVMGTSSNPVDSWIIYDNAGTSPSWKLLVGGNGSNEAGKVCSFYGDSHIMMMQGEVENIIGGNFRTNSDTLFSGSSYISIYDGEVRGFVVGAGTLGNGTNTSTFVGNSNIFVYTILSNSSNAWLDPASSNLTQDNASVIGGAAQGNGGGTIAFRGNTNITVDLRGVTPTGTSDVFNKKLVGGSYTAGGTITVTHTGSTNITVQAEDTHSFTKDIIGGSVVGNNGTAIHGGTINVSLNGGQYSGSVYLGGYMAGSNRSITNSSLSTLTVTAGRFTGSVVGGIYEGSGTSTVISDGITMDLQGGEYTRLIVGGHVITGTGTAAVSRFATGDITLQLGADAEILGTVIGGSISQRTDARASSLTQGNITIEIADGATVNGSIYAAGGALNVDGTSSASTSKIVTESTRVAIASGATLGTVTISGGYKAGTAAAAADLAAVSEVTGSKTLALTSDGSGLQEVLKNVTLESFDTIEITSAKGSATLTAGMVNAGIVSKTGAGTLVLDASNADTLAVQEGTLSIGAQSSEVSTLTMAAGTRMDFTQSDALTVGTLNCTAGTVTLDLSGLGTLSLGTHLTLATVNDLTGWDNLDVQGLDPDFEDGLAWQNHLLTITITAKPGVYVWDAATAGNVWQNGKPFSADGSNYSNSDATKVRFDNIAGENATDTVTLRGDLTVNGRLAINPGATNTYVFQADSSQGGTVTQVQQIDIQSGTAVFGAGTLSLSGSTKTAIGVEAGAQLVMADAGAGQFGLTLGSQKAGATFTWQGLDQKKSTINGTVTAQGGSAMLLEGGSLTLAGSGNTLNDVTLSNTATLDLQGDTTLTGTLSSADGNQVTLTGAAGTVLTLDDTARLDHITLAGSQGTTLNISGSNVTVSGNTQLSGMLLQVEKGGKITFEAPASLTGAGVSSWTGISSEGTIAGVQDLLLVLPKSETYTCGGSLENLQGTITVSGRGTQVIDATVAAAPNPATLSFAVEQQATLVLGSQVTNIADLSVGTGAQSQLIVNKGDGTNATKRIETLTAEAGSTLTLSADLAKPMLVEGTAGEGAVQVTNSINYTSGSNVVLDVTGIGTGLDLTGGNTVTLIVMESSSVIGKANLSTTATSDKLLSKYFGTTAVLKQEGNALVVTGTTVTPETATFYKSAASSANGRVGAVMLDGLYSTLNPQANDPSSDAAAILSSIEQTILSGNAAAADQKMTAVSGAGVSAMGAAFAADMQRQLAAIRNRTTTMGLGDTYETPDMPYFNAWVNAEANYREMNDDGTMPGYELSSWGATVGVDADVTPYLTCGLALTAMYGDFTAKTTDTAEGDLDIYYVTAFARYAPSAWVHTFVASVGIADASVDRTVAYAGGSYRTSGDTNGVSIGLMYEVGYTIPMNEDATTALQPIANITYAHSSLDGYTESGSDLAVRYGDQTLDMVSIGLGLRAQTVIGENIYNRTSLLEGRVLAKFDLGDRSSSMGANLASLPSFGGTVESAESGVFGVEIGAGVTIPISQEGGSIFVDAALELRSDYTSVNGTVGYRLNF